MNRPLMTALTLSAALLCAQFVQAAEQPTVSAGDMAYMKQKQTELEQFQAQLKGMNITLPPAQQIRCLSCKTKSPRPRLTRTAPTGPRRRRSIL